jgi:hypothetical protein
MAPKTENESLNRTNSRDNNELQIVVSSTITLPDGWLVEQRFRRRSSDPNRVDRVSNYSSFLFHFTNLIIHSFMHLNFHFILSYHIMHPMHIYIVSVC